jgi:hypothetical protein
VVEIEGEATLIEETEIKEAKSESVTVTPPAMVEEAAESQISTRASSTIREHHDEIVTAKMESRRLVVMPG